MGRMKIVYTCPTCGKEFNPIRTKQVYCSKPCVPKWNAGLKTGQPAWNKQDLTAICEVCGKEYKTIKSRMETSRYCSLDCSYIALSAKMKGHGGVSHHGFKDGSSQVFYRREALKIYDEKCNRCGSLTKLLVHHSDGNHKNNPIDGSNWEILCRRCHQLAHHCEKRLPKNKWLLYKTGRKGRTAQITGH